MDPNKNIYYVDNQGLRTLMDKIAGALARMNAKLDKAIEHQNHEIETIKYMMADLLADKLDPDKLNLTSLHERLHQVETLLSERITREDIEKLWDNKV